MAENKLEVHVATAKLAAQEKRVAEEKSKRGLQIFELHGVQETDNRLGRGSYAYVVEMKYRGLKCAGKKLHHFEQAHETHMLERFEKECELLAELKHPNIVQFLGVHFEENSTLPTLVMEYMYTTLSHCLERYGTLSQEISYSILDDVATALYYLHGNNPPIIHRDLTANNVLLTADMRAKVGDLGVAKILNLSIDKRTPCPGCPAYMPPEALCGNPQYGTEIDCFSYGVLILHTFCGEWPTPDWVARKDTHDSTTLSEADRRKKHLSKMGHEHPLKQLVLECLSNNPIQRPNAEDIQTRVHTNATRFPQLFENSLLVLQENQKLMDNLVKLNQLLRSMDQEKHDTEESNASEARERIRETTAGLIAENQRLQSKLEDLETHGTYEIIQLRGDIKSMSTELVELNSKLTSSEKQRELEGATFTKVQGGLAIKVNQLATANKELATKQQQIENKENQLKNLQEKFEAQEQQLKAGHLEHKQRVEELEALYKQFSALQDQLAAKDGQLSAKQEQSDATLRQLAASKKEIELKQEELDMATTEQTQTKTKESELLMDLANKDELIAASNAEIDNMKMDRLPMLESQIQMKEHSVKILSSQLKHAQEYIHDMGKRAPLFCPLQIQFEKCADLPIAMSDPQCAVVDGIVYVGGGLTDEKVGTLGQGQVFEYNQALDEWNTLPDCPTRLFGLAQYRGNLLLLGGVTETGMLSGRVYTFNKTTKSWEEGHIPPMLTKRFHMTVISHGTALAVCGGVVQGRNVTNAVEVFTNGTWRKGPELPHRCCLSKQVIIGNQCYLMGGLFCISPDAPTKVVLSTKLSSLFAESSENGKRKNAWEIHSTEICKITQYKSAPANYGGMLIAFGGWDSALLSPSSDILLYSSRRGFWMKVADLHTACSSSTATTQLQNGHILIAGGFEKEAEYTKRSAAVLSMSLYF